MCVCVYVCVYVLGFPKMPEEVVRAPGAGVYTQLPATSHGYWKLNSGPLNEQQILLATEPFLQTPVCILKC